MRNPLLTLAALALPLGGLSGGWLEVGPEPDEVAVRAVVQSYFESTFDGPPERLRAALHPDAVLLGVVEEGPLLRTALSPGWDGRAHLPSCGAGRARLLSVDITGNAAVAKAEIARPGLRSVDYLSLLRIDGEWKIVGGISDRERTRG